MSNPEPDDAKIVAAILDYDAAKRAYGVAKKMAEADLKAIAREGYLTNAEDAMMRASLRRAEASLALLRELLGT